MEELVRIKKISIWIFIVPVVAINVFLFISINYELLENTIFTVDQIGRSGFSIPYIDGSLSISRSARTYPAYLVFKPGMLITALLLIKYWFENKEHEEWDHGKENYYVHTFYDNIVKNLPIPEEGKILIMGTHNCHSFDKLCKHFGYDRCIGYDLHNPTKHPNVFIKNCMELSDNDKIDIAFCHNDLGNYFTRFYTSVYL